MAKASGRDAEIFIKDDDVSTYFQEIEASSEAGEIDTTTFGLDFKRFMGGLVDGSMSMSGLFDATTDGSDDVLHEALTNTPGVAFPITVAPIGWAVGTPVLMLSGIASTYNIDSDVEEAVTVDSEFVGAGGSRLAHCLLAPTAVTPTGSAVDGANVDNPKAAATTEGARAHLHVIANAYNQSTTFKVQHSSDGTTFADLITFTAVGATTKASEIKTVADGVTINRYVRSRYTGAAGAGTLRAAIGFMRNY